MAASSSMIRIRCCGSVETLALLCGARMPASDMDWLPCRREFEMERGSAAHLAFYLDLARVLLNDAVGHCQSQSCAAPLALADRQLGGEKGVVNALHVFQRDARAGVGDIDRHMPVRLGGHPQCPAGRHSILGVYKQVEKDLLQFAGVAQNRRQVILE